MNKYIIDSYAWIEYLDGSDSGLKVRDILLGDAELFTVSISVAEVVSRTKRRRKDVDIAYNTIVRNSKIVDVTEELGREAGIQHAEIRAKIKDFGLADAIILTTARKLGAKVLTGDPHFKGFKEVVFIK
ncbi:MAG TPA: type II toxin-antitoxin system VapC family toxin [Nanoarchaeota archaeon]|nr:type II toxin-antitoxin system VapC family toxin [Nanoarchaeota archaeon]